MIYTYYGVPVKVIGNPQGVLKVKEGFMDELLLVQSLKDPCWVRERLVSQLRADGGIDEIRREVTRLGGVR